MIPTFAKSLHRASQNYARSFAESQNGSALTVTQYLALEALAALHCPVPMTQSRLVEITDIDRSTLSAMLPTMVARGLVRRSRSKIDGRAVTVEITTSGRRALSKAAKAALAARREFARSPAAADLRAVMA